MFERDKRQLFLKIFFFIFSQTHMDVSLLEKRYLHNQFLYFIRNK